MSECTHNCSTCSANCSSRQKSREEMFEKPNDLSSVKHIIGVCSGKDIKSISDFCGFQHPNSLRKFFLKETGMTLSAWRKDHLNKPMSDNLPAV